ncbi:tRNA lysidine(34) synthetase [Streptomyces smyrnaeus]|uniref:hypothetical protein n=1 Tax=Streptomyces smyrnaeus TaxID=1387713 RepID=UPI000C1865CD
MGRTCDRTSSPTIPATAAAVPDAFDWDRQDFIVVGSSAGKDSSVMLDTVCRQADAAGQLHKVHVLHCDLGKTLEGHDVEWPGVAELARRQAAAYGVPFAVRRSTQWEGLYQRILAHGKFPGHFARYCTVICTSSPR